MDAKIGRQNLTVKIGRQNLAVKIVKSPERFESCQDELKQFLFSFSTIDDIQLWLLALTKEFIGELQIQSRKVPPVGTCSKKGLAFIRCRTCEIIKCHGFLYPVICMACYKPEDHAGDMRYLKLELDTIFSDCDVSEISQTGNIYCDAGNQEWFSKEVACISNCNDIY